MTKKELQEENKRLKEQIKTLDLKVSTAMKVEELIRDSKNKLIVENEKLQHGNSALNDENVSLRHKYNQLIDERVSELQSRYV